MEGSPWMVGRHAVLLKKYDSEVLPQHVVFDRLAIWARILALPPRMMNVDRGRIIAEPIGLVKKVESDALGRCWGGFMRVEVKVDEPLMRAVTVFSSKLKTTESYDVQYERLPYYCFSCGLLGHSYLACANPADRDENGDLPYPAKRLSVDEFLKKSGSSKNGTNVSSTAQSGTAANGAQHGKSSVSPGAIPQQDDPEVSSPAKQGRGGARGRGRAPRGRGGGRSIGVDKDALPSNPKQATAGRKRKSAKEPKQPTLLIEGPQLGNNSLAIVPVGATPPVLAEGDDANSLDSHKKSGLHQHDRRIRRRLRVSSARRNESPVLELSRFGF
jgi:hypothetical protein